METTQGTNLRPHSGHAVRNLVWAVLLVGAFFLIPVVPYMSSTVSPSGLANFEVNAKVSLSYALMHCGYVLNPQSTAFAHNVRVFTLKGESKFACGG